MSQNRTYAKPRPDGAHVLAMWALSSVLPRKPKAPPPPRTCPTCSSARTIADGYRSGALACLAGVNGASRAGTFTCHLYTSAK